MIHIQRIAGTSIERWIAGSNWWVIQPETKHLLASQAKSLYQEHWDDYFKFSFVRNPWDRTVSMLKYQDHFGIKHDEKFDFSEYMNKHGHPVTLEHDYRFYEYQDLLGKKHTPHNVYLNILDEPLDFIGRFETLEKDTAFIKKKLNIKDPFAFHEDKSDRKEYQDYFDQGDKDFISNLYKKDIEEFGFTF